MRRKAGQLGARSGKVRHPVGRAEEYRAVSRSIWGGLQFIDAAGLGEIVCLRATLSAAGRQLTLRRPFPRIRRTFALGGLAELLR